METVMNRTINSMINETNRSMLDSMANEYFDLTGMEMNHNFNYVDHLIWVYDKIIEEDPYHFSVHMMGRNNANSLKFLKCLTAVLIQQAEGAKELFKTVMVDNLFKPVEGLATYYNDFIEDRIEDFRCGHGKTSTLLEMLQYVADMVILRDPTNLLKNDLKYESYNRLHYRNYQADSIFPKWIESLVEQAKLGGRKLSLYESAVFARASESNISLDVDKETRFKFLYNLAVSVVLELSNKFTADEISIRLSMLRPGLFSLGREEDIAGILDKLNDMVGRDRLFATYRIFGYFLYHTHHSEQLLETMVAECQLDKKEGWIIG